MNYNIEYLTLKHALIRCFLVNADKNMLDVSYSVDQKKMIIQLVQLEGTIVSNERIDFLKKSLNDFDIVLKEVFLTKVQFNENKGNWPPQYYQWLDHLLFSKAEIS